MSIFRNASRETSDEILNNGYVMCNTLRTTDEDVHTVAVLAAPQIGVSVGLAAGEVGAAVRWLCPDQIWQVARSHFIARDNPEHRRRRALLQLERLGYRVTLEPVVT